jgi:hypothetical protein
MIPKKPAPDVIRGGNRFRIKIMHKGVRPIEVHMRVASILSLSVAAATILALASPADAQRRRVYRDQTERITIIDENGRARTKITVRPRSFLDGGTEVLPGERKFMDYAQAPTYGWLAPTSSWDPLGTHRFPLPMPFELPGYSPYSYY